jgi:ABC-type phosphate/phosphonate transport system substrate-binding protein
MSTLALALALLAAPAAAASTAPPKAATAAPTTLVFCAPGYPGTTAEAQPRMDRLAAALARLAGWPEGSVAAVYQPAEKAGVARLAEDRGAALAVVPLPFFVAHGEELKLEPRLQVVSGAATETWTLVAKRGRVAAPADLARFEVLSTAGYAPAFVRGALRGWGALPESTHIAPSAQVLSGLRKAASGADVALLLDGAQAAALPKLPFAADLEPVARSEPLPTSFLATVGDRLSASRWAALAKAFAALPSDPEGAAALQGLEIQRFAPAEPQAVAAARKLAGRGG